MSIHDFIKRCDAFCDATGQSRTWLSKKLFSDTFKIENLAAGAVDIGVRRLGKACIDLELLERRREGLVVLHAETLPGGAGLGAENLERNVSRTDEPGSSASAAALAHTAASHQVGSGYTLQEGQCDMAYWQAHSVELTPAEIAIVLADIRAHMARRSITV